MRKLFEALGVIITPLLKLGEEIDRYTERKKITDRLFVALSTEINDFNKNSDDLSREAEIVLIPIIENVKDSPGIPEIKK